MIVCLLLRRQILLLRKFAKMSWRDIIITQLSNKLPNKTKLSTSDLVGKLLEKGMIPEAIRDNATLHGVLLSEILLKTLDGIEVPRAPQNEEKIGDGIYLRRFSYRMNAKEMLISQMGRRNAERIKDLERETGVSLEHYHKLNERKKCFGDGLCAKDGLSKKRGSEEFVEKTCLPCILSTE